MLAKGQKLKEGQIIPCIQYINLLIFVKTEKGKCIATVSRLKDREYQFINVKFQIIAFMIIMIT